MAYNILLIQSLTFLKESDDQLRYMVNFLTQGLVTIDPNGKIINISGIIAQLGGYSLDEIIDHNIIEFVHNQDKEKLQENLKKSLANENKNILDDYRLLLKSGEVYWSRITATPVKKYGVHTGFICLLLDAEKFKQSEEKLNTLDPFLNYSSNLFWCTNMKLVFTYISPSIENLLGFTSEEACRINFGLTYSKKTVDKLYNAFVLGLKAAKNGDSEWKTIIPVEQYSKNSKKLSGELLLMIRLGLDGKPSGITGITHYNLRNPFNISLTS
jgi:PAS domain S-box-containing protein